MLSANVVLPVADQGIQVATLGPILADETVIRFLGANFAQTLAAVFTAPRGLNIRNNTAHGFADPAQDQIGTALLALFGVLTVGFGLHVLQPGRADAAEPGAPGPPEKRA